MNMKSRLEKIEAELMASREFPWEIIAIKDEEEHLRATLQGPGKIVITESELQAMRAKVERARAEGSINFFSSSFRKEIC